MPLKTVNQLIWSYLKQMRTIDTVNEWLKQSEADCLSHPYITKGLIVEGWYYLHSFRQERIQIPFI